MIEKAGYIKYKMPFAMAQDLMKGKNKSHTQEILCQIVNEQFGLKGQCIEVILF